MEDQSCHISHEGTSAIESDVNCEMKMLNL